MLTKRGTGAEDASQRDGMFWHPYDLAYLGVHAVWMGDLGIYPSRRLTVFCIL
jgi:hypothetical protein